MTWKLLIFDVPIAIVAVAIAAQMTTHYDLTQWRPALSVIATGALARLAPELLAVLEFYRAKIAGPDAPPPPMQPPPAA